MEKNKIKLFENDYLNIAFYKANISYILRNDIIYFDVNNVDKVINFCKIFKISILGIDSFELEKEFIVDLMEIYDASTLVGENWEIFIEKSIKGALSFIKQNKNPAAVFEFVFIEQNEYLDLLLKHK